MWYFWERYSVVALLARQRRALGSVEAARVVVAVARVFADAVEGVLALLDFQVCFLLRFFFLQPRRSWWESSRTPPTKARANPTPQGKQLTRRAPKRARHENKLEDPPPHF